MSALLLVGLLVAGDLRLIDAVKQNDAATVRSLIAQHVDVNATETDGSTALHWAAQRDNLEIAGLLLSAGANAKAATCVPPAHPEGYLEAFANIYKNFANHIRAQLENRKLAKDDPALDYPKVEDAIRGMSFIEAVVKSSKKNAAWTRLDV